MLKKLLIVVGILVLAIVILAGVVAMQPAEYRVSRSAKITAPPSDIFPHVNDFRKWDDWSPWHKIDPKMTKTHEGSESGKGAILKWAGNSEAGKGMMTIQETKTNELIKILLEFQEPFPGQAITDFAFKSEGTETVVTWSIAGEHSFPGKAISLFKSMDKMIGDQYEKGLTDLKKLVETKKSAG